MMKTLTQKQMDQMDEIGRMYGFEFYLPPIKNRNNPFFVCDTRENKASELIRSLHKNGFDYTISFEGKKQFVEIVLK